jgi:hypothetical protein
MKKFFYLITFLFTAYSSFSQSISCQSLKREIESEADLESSTTCYGSSALAKVEYYTSDGEGYVIAYLKSSDFDLYGRPYIFCGISSARWDKFVSEGRSGSWGKAFNAFIRDYLCNCY